jgi:hypothetical protein
MKGGCEVVAKAGALQAYGISGAIGGRLGSEGLWSVSLRPGQGGEDAKQFSI